MQGSNRSREGEKRLLCDPDLSYDYDGREIEEGEEKKGNEKEKTKKNTSIVWLTLD